MTSIKAVLNKERIKKSGGYSLVIQVIHLRQKRIVYLGYDLPEANFNLEKEKVVYHKEYPLSRKEAKQINEKIKETKDILFQRLGNLEFYGIEFTVVDIISCYRKDKNSIFLFIYLQNQINEKRRVSKLGIADAYQSTLHSLRHFLNDKIITFDDINIKFLRDYENYLISEDLAQNTINYYMRNLRTIYNRACDDGLISHELTPFRKYHLCSVSTIKRALKKDVIQRIANLDLSDQPQVQEARDFFMFSFYTRGMSSIDILHLKHTDIIDNTIYYERHKTHQQLQIAITAPLQNLLDKYHKDPVYALPFINQMERSSLREQYKAVYSQINRNLKKVASSVGIRTPLTTYVARHSWASIAKKEGAPIAAISEGLGHTSEKTTTIYLSNFDKEVIDKINSKVVLF